MSSPLPTPAPASRALLGSLAASVLAASLLSACNGHAPRDDVDAPPSETPPPTPATPAEAEPQPQPQPTQPPESAPAQADATAEAPPQPAKPLTPEQLPEGYLWFTDACEPGERITIAAVGDVLLHQELQRQAYAAPERHLSLWGGVVDQLERADLTYANLEGPLAAGVTRTGKQIKDPGLVYDNKVYTAYPRFNFHPSLAESLVKSGVDIVSTANNHALDRHSIGVDKTLDALDEAGLLHMGTRRKNASARAPWHVITKTGGVRLAWIACAHHTNQIEDDEDQVLYCFRNEDQVVKLIKRLTRKQGPKGDFDAIIVTPHWGKEYKPEPRQQQRNLAHRMANAGATAIIGSHPHVTQPWEKYVAKDGREVFIHYSLGNFASHQTDLPKRSSILLYVGLTKAKSGEVRVNGVRYVPLHVRPSEDGEKFYTEAIDRVGGAEDSRALTLDMYGRYNLIAPDAALTTNAHCDAGFEFPAR